MVVRHQHLWTFPQLPCLHAIVVDAAALLVALDGNECKVFAWTDSSASVLIGDAMTDAEKITQAVTEGYPDVDEVCPECKVVFKNYHHFIRCDRRPCPMSDGKGTLLERLLG